MIADTLTLALTLTCYHATAAQCNSNYLVTASRARIESTETAYQHRYLAISQDLMDSIPWGTVAIIEGCHIKDYNGEWKVQDAMNRRWTNMCDILINPGMPLTKEKVTVKFIKTTNK